MLAIPPELFLASTNKGSSIVNVVDSMVVVVPLTVKFPPIIALPVVSNDVNFPVDGVVKPIVVLSISPLAMSTAVTATCPVPFGVMVMSVLVDKPVMVWLSISKLFNSIDPSALMCATSPAASVKKCISLASADLSTSIPVLPSSSVI